MSISVFDLFKIGIGPSSSHTVGPMRAARRFAQGLAEQGVLDQVATVKAELFGSLGATGKGHGSDKAVLLGLEGQDPETVDVRAVDEQLARIRRDNRLRLWDQREIAFREKEHLVMHRRKTLPYHPNGMTFAAFDGEGQELRRRTYYSVGGGFVVDEAAAGADRIVADTTALPHPFKSGRGLLALCAERGKSISQIMLENEQAWRSEAEIRAGLLKIWEVMQECVANGCRNEGIMPGGLKVQRRAAELYRKLSSHPEAALRDPLTIMDWVNLYALAVNEENAAGGRVVTAPTNGAAGIIPAVLHYYVRFVPWSSEEGVVRFLL
ncbi:MAG: L-serine ammonia-lyase, partial [Candidatus Competibacteraceae bacterium]|nr:L-serine ammonia-lyase [Candidatus Competibacteraceae bacterium]